MTSTAVRTPQVYAQHSIAWSANDPAHRNIRADLIKNGWAWFADNQLDPARKLGYDAGWLHNPYGCRLDTAPGDIESDMRLDQRMLAEMDEMDLHTGFQAMLEKQVASWPMVVYFGQPAMEEGSFFKLVSDLYPGSVDRGMREAISLRYARWCVDAALKAGCTIGLDGSSGVKDGDIYYAIWKDLKLHARSVIVEANPSKDCPWLFKDRFCVATEWLQKLEAHPEWAATFSAPFSALTGEMIVVSNQIYLDATLPFEKIDLAENLFSDWDHAFGAPSPYSDMIVRQFNHGRSVGIPPWWFIQNGVNVKNWLRDRGARI